MSGSSRLPAAGRRLRSVTVGLVVALAALSIAASHASALAHTPANGPGHQPVQPKAPNPSRTHGKPGHQGPALAQRPRSAAVISIGAGPAHGPGKAHGPKKRSGPGHTSATAHGPTKQTGPAHKPAKGKASRGRGSNNGRHLARGHERSDAGHAPGRARGHRSTNRADAAQAATNRAAAAEAPTLTAVRAIGTNGRGALPQQATNGRHGEPTHRAPSSTNKRPPDSALSPTKAAGPVLAPLRGLGKVISRVPGLSVFGGPLGWVLTGLLLLAVCMVAAALLLGRRPVRPAKTPPA